MKREDLQQYLETAKPAIENVIAQAIKSSNGNVALQLNLRLCYAPADDLANPLDAAGQIVNVLATLWETLDTLAFEKDYLPQAAMADGPVHESDHASIGYPSSFDAFVINPDNDEILVEITPTGQADAKERLHPQA